MVADLVHQHVGDDGAERLVVLGPVVEDRPAIEPDHVRHLHRRAFGAERQADALEQAEQVELGLGAPKSSSTSSVGKSSTRMTRPSHNERNFFGRRRNASVAITSNSSSEGALIVRQARGSENGVSAMVAVLGDPGRSAKTGGVSAATQAGVDGRP